MTTLGRIGRWVSSLGDDDVPAAARHAALRCVVDLSGVMAAGAGHRSAVLARRLAERWFAAGPAWVAGSEQCLQPAGAAFANAVAGHVLDFDDTSYAGILHASTVVFPAVFAEAEAYGADGRRLLTAYVAGVETVYGLGKLVTDHMYLKGHFNTAALGAAGAAAGTARLMNLDEAETVCALAHATSQAAGLRAAFGKASKPFLVARAAETGVRSAETAAAGVDAPEGYFDDKAGFLQVLNDGVRHPEALDQLGKTYSLLDPGVMFKLFPVCSAAHAATEETIAAMRDGNLTADEVESVLCEVTPLVVTCLSHRLPETPAEAQFSMDFPVAAALVHGDVTPDLLSAEHLADPAFRRHMEKVEMRVAPELDRAPDHLRGCEEAAYVTVRGRDGHTLERRYRAVSTGAPGNPMTDADLNAKFRKCAAFAGLSDGGAAALLARLRNLPSIASVRGLLAFEGADRP